MKNWGMDKHFCTDKTHTQGSTRWILTHISKLDESQQAELVNAGVSWFCGEKELLQTHLLAAEHPADLHTQIPDTDLTLHSVTCFIKWSSNRFKAFSSEINTGSNEPPGLKANFKRATAATALIIVVVVVNNIGLSINYEISEGCLFQSCCLK